MQTQSSASIKAISIKVTSIRATAALMVLLCVSLVIPARAQQTPSSASGQDEVNKQLLDRIQELEKQVQQLKGQPAPAPAPAPPPPPPPEPVAEAPTVNEVAPRLKLNVFGDMGAQVYRHNPDTFYFGSLDLFMTARLSDKVSALGEVLFIALNDNNIQPDVERLLLQYRQSDYLTASIGRYHTSVGYYNTAFNYGAFLETTIDRPFMYAFDNQGGVLPMQDIGVHATGKIPSGKLGLNYIVEAGNGEAWGLNSEPAQNNQDANNSKSINGGLFARPEKLPGLQLGFSVRHDNLSLPGPPIAETIATVHAVFINSKYEILNEGVLVRHVTTTGDLSCTSAFYTQWSRAFRNYRPYFRYQYFNAPSDDPVYLFAGPNTFAPASVSTFVGRLNGPSVGLRYDFTEHSALKVQYDHLALRALPTQDAVSLQVAFTF